MDVNRVHYPISTDEENQKLGRLPHLRKNNRFLLMKRPIQPQKSRFGLHHRSLTTEALQINSGELTANYQHGVAVLHIAWHDVLSRSIVLLRIFISTRET